MFICNKVVHGSSITIYRSLISKIVIDCLKWLNYVALVQCIQVAFSRECLAFKAQNNSSNEINALLNEYVSLQFSILLLTRFATNGCNIRRSFKRSLGFELSK